MDNNTKNLLVGGAVVGGVTYFWDDIKRFGRNTKDTVTGFFTKGEVEVLPDPGGNDGIAGGQNLFDTLRDSDVEGGGEVADYLEEGLDRVRQARDQAVADGHSTNGLDQFLAMVDDGLIPFEQ